MNTIASVVLCTFKWVTRQTDRNFAWTLHVRWHDVNCTFRLCSMGHVGQSGHQTNLFYLNSSDFPKMVDLSRTFPPIPQLTNPPPMSCLRPPPPFENAQEISFKVSRTPRHKANNPVGSPPTNQQHCLVDGQKDSNGMVGLGNPLHSGPRHGGACHRRSRTRLATSFRITRGFPISLDWVLQKSCKVLTGWGSFQFI